jgi:hypothetical protein
MEVDAFLIGLAEFTARASTALRIHPAFKKELARKPPSAAAFSPVIRKSCFEISRDRQSV